MGQLELLLKDHQRLKELDINSESFKKALKEHFDREEKFLEKHKEKLGGDDSLSPLGMVKNEHKLLLEYLEKGKTEEFKQLFQYHLFKEETQIFTLFSL